jgi:hypothetical protein
MYDKRGCLLDAARSTRPVQPPKRYVPDGADTHVQSVVGEANPGRTVDGARAYAYMLSSEYPESRASPAVDQSEHTAPMVGTEESHRGNLQDLAFCILFAVVIPVSRGNVWRGVCFL